MAVTVCAVFQFEDVKVRVDGLTVPSPVSELLTATVTLAVGWLESFAVNVAVVPYSVVTPLIVVTVNPAVSSSMFTTERSSGSVP